LVSNSQLIIWVQLVFPFGEWGYSGVRLGTIGGVLFRMVLW